MLGDWWGETTVLLSSAHRFDLRTYQFHRVEHRQASLRWIRPRGNSEVVLGKRVKVYRFSTDVRPMTSTPPRMYETAPNSVNDPRRTIKTTASQGQSLRGVTALELTLGPTTTADYRPRDVGTKERGKTMDDFGPWDD